jgi:endoglucanase
MEFTWLIILVVIVLLLILIFSFYSKDDPKQQTLSTSNSSSFKYYGVNLAGAEFTPSNIPGQYDKDYTYPTSQEVDYYMSKGVNTFRIPFLWERLQPTLKGPLDSTELNRLTTIVNYITQKGAYSIIDPHNYARYHGNLLVNDNFQDFWKRLADVFKNNDKVIFELMNEPNSMPTEQWLSGANSGIAGIRSTGAKNLILVPGNAWTGAHSWQQNWYGTSNSQVMIPENIKDPLNNYMYDIHQYLDSNYSGTNPNCVNFDANKMLEPFTSWAKTHTVKAIVTEIGVGNNPNCLIQLDAMLNYMKQNNDVYQGFIYWAGGPMWGSYEFSIEPQGKSDKPQMAIIQKYFKS